MTVFGEKEAKGLWVGDSPAKAAYFGNELVWGGEGPQPQWWGLCLEALDAGSTVSMKKQGSAPAVTLEYSTDAETWNAFTPGTTTVALANAGDKAFFRAGSGGNSAFASSDSASWSFQMTGRIKASGNIMSMLSGDAELQEFPNTSQQRQFQDMFMGCSALVDVDGLGLPAKDLPGRCYQNLLQQTGISRGPVLHGERLREATYQGMFLGCQQLLEAPSLQSITSFGAAYGCFAMFRSCSALTASPDLPPVTGGYSYWNLFEKCVALSTAPALPATTIASNNSYYQMFMDCVSLTATPYLPAQSAGGNGYYYMFQNCRNLRQVSVELTSFSGAGYWMQNVSSNGDFYCPTALGTNETITRGQSGCPNNWTVHNH